MKTHSLIAVAALAAFTTGSAFAQGPWGDDLAYAPMSELGASTLTRDEVRADLFTARSDGRLLRGGEIATTDPAWISRVSAETMANKLPLEVTPVSFAAATEPARAEPYAAPPAVVLWVELNERGEPTIVEVVELDVD